MAVLKPDGFGATYIAWADSITIVLGGYDAEGNPHVTIDGTVTPAANPYDWQGAVAILPLKFVPSTYLLLFGPTNSVLISSLDCT